MTNPKRSQLIDVELLRRIQKYGTYGDSFNAILDRIVEHYEKCKHKGAKA